VALLTVNLVLGAVMGLVRGATMRIWRSTAGDWMMQGTILTFACWVVSIGLRLAIGASAHADFPTNEIALFIAVTFGAQNLVVGARLAGLAPAALPVRTR
jgi:hypothetical protein